MDVLQKKSLRRTACDPCRQQRLRCLRNDGQPSCQRCARLGKACLMAEARPPGRPRKGRLAQAVSGPPTGEKGRRTVAAVTDEAEAQLASSLILDGPLTFDSISTSPRDSTLSLTDTSQNFDFGTFDFPFGAVPLPRDAHPKQPNPPVDYNQCLKELSQLNVELHSQRFAVRTKENTVNLDSLICGETTDLGLSESTIAARCMNAIQKFYKVISNVEKLLGHESESLLNQEISRDLDSDLTSLDGFLDLDCMAPWEEIIKGATAEASLEARRMASPRLDSALALAIISCYVQLIELFSDIFGQLQAYLMHHRNRPIPSVSKANFPEKSDFSPIESGHHGLMFYALEGRLQGLMFCTTVSHYLDRIERILGLLPSSRRQTVPVRHPLLNFAHYQDLLEKEWGNEDISRRASPNKLRQAVENLRCILTEDPSW